MSAVGAALRYPPFAVALAWRGLCHALRRTYYLIGAMRVSVSGRSMEPELRDGDRLLLSRTILWRGQPRRGQIVFLRCGAGRATNPECIKRIVGLPHERVRVIAGAVTVNGAPLIESYLPYPASAAERGMLKRALERTPEVELTLTGNEYLVLGDNRLHSADSRTYGPVERSTIAGVAVYRYAPRGRRGWLLP